MQNINIDDGKKTFMINNDTNRVISFNPADLSIIERIRDVYNNVEKYKETIGEDIELDASGNPKDNLETSANVVANFRKYICEQINYIFDGQVSEVVFGNQSPLSSVNGKAFYERFIEAVLPFINEEIKKEQEASRKRIDKYVKQVK